MAPAAAASITGSGAISSDGDVQRVFVGSRLAAEGSLVGDTEDANVSRHKREEAHRGGRFDRQSRAPLDPE